ncbi:unnamed protein product [Peniophora sp. CBMAI 1063]|nr:unnamed protein product [Peniophora sp. CBMAI 1063]
MDWIFCGALSFVRAAQVTVCYDIACQWSKRLRERLLKISPYHKIWEGVKRFQWHFDNNSISYVVPKFHLFAHKLICQLRYALGHLRGAAATDGEGCERVWAGANPAASSLREMGPGGMSDTMDDMCGSWNWQKVCGISSLLRERMQRALSEALQQTAIFTEFTEAIEEEDPAKLGVWRSRVMSWEESEVAKDRTPSPYHVERKNVLSVAEIKLQSEQAQGSGRGTLLEDESALAQFLLRGLEIESERSRFTTQYVEIGGTVSQAEARTNALNSIGRAVNSFRCHQEDHMPMTYASLTLDEREPDRRNVMSVKLYMPSAPPGGDESMVPPAARIMEAKLRWASMADELDNLRHQLRLKGCLNKFKLANVTGQRGNTRARAAQDAVDARVRRAADAYRRHRAAYVSLIGEGDWTSTMRKLEDSDCRGLGDRLLEQMEEMSEYNAQRFLAGRRGADTQGETAYKLPWIWYNMAEESGIQITDGTS